MFTSVSFEKNLMALLGSDKHSVGAGAASTIAASSGNVSGLMADRGSFQGHATECHREDFGPGARGPGAAEAPDWAEGQRQVRSPGHPKSPNLPGIFA